MISIALFQPDQPGNFGAILRLCACFGAGLHVIEPCGFPLDDARIRRAGMDYAGQVPLARHASWEAFQATMKPESKSEHSSASPLVAAGLRPMASPEGRAGASVRRLLLFTTHGDAPYYDFAYQSDDILLFGSESAGVPQHVHDAADARLVIPLSPRARSLNLAMSAAIALGHAALVTKP